MRRWKPKEPSPSHTGVAPESQRHRGVATFAKTAPGIMSKSMKLKTDMARPEWTVETQKVTVTM